VNPRSTSKRIRAEEQIAEFYFALRRTFGHQHWWPAQTSFEVVLGAYLTQNTSWSNVELALARLRTERLLTVSGIRRTPQEHLEQLIRSTGYFRQKARAVKTFVEFLDIRYAGSLARMFAQPTPTLREELLELRGVGPETADSILLYAGQHASFVVDTYTRRVLARHRLLPAAARYEEIKSLCEAGLSSIAGQNVLHESPAPPNPLAHPPSPMSAALRSPLAQIYNDMHGLFVSVGKTYCLKKQPRCEGCPLHNFLPPTGPLPLEQKSRPKPRNKDGSMRRDDCI
jgi:endonuclease-3 related protein